MDAETFQQNIISFLIMLLFIPVTVTSLLRLLMAIIKLLIRLTKGKVVRGVIMDKTILENMPRILETCTGCGYCYLLCPQNAIQTVTGSKYQIVSEHCIICEKCVFACPVDAIEHPLLFHTERQDLCCIQNKANMKKDSYDVIIIGSGIGGLLTAASLSQRGKKIVVLERLNFFGGRFANINYQGTCVNTGAYHIIPHGENGPFAEMIRSLNLPVNIHNSEGVGSLNINGKQYRWKNIMGFLAPFSFVEKIDLLKIIVKILTIGESPCTASFEDWLKRQSSSEMIMNFFDRMINFGCSSSINLLTYDKVREIVKNVYRHGFSGVPEGGCGNIVDKLVKQIIDRDGDILTVTEVTELLIDNGSVTGVKASDRKNGNSLSLKAKTVISDIGPKETLKLLKDENGIDCKEKAEIITNTMTKATIKANANTNKDRVDIMETSGLCIRFLSDAPLLFPSGIMLCLDTARVAGIVQPTNIDPGLAPEGKHLLISYQMLKDSDVEKELDLGLADLVSIFGESFNKHCRVLGTSVFKNGWPVNRAVQGYDYPCLTSVRGLYLVGDGCKTSGYVMVEGIAKQVANVLSQIN